MKIKEIRILREYRRFRQPPENPGIGEITETNVCAYTLLYPSI